MQKIKKEMKGNLTRNERKCKGNELMRCLIKANKKQKGDKNARNDRARKNGTEVGKNGR